MKGILNATPAYDQVKGNSKMNRMKILLNGIIKRESYAGASLKYLALHWPCNNHGQKWTGYGFGRDLCPDRFQSSDLLF